MAYTDIDKPSDYFNTKLYTGNGATNRSITGVGFQPDLTWIKARSDTTWHHLFDAVRGANKALNSNVSNAEGTVATFPSFDSDGFTVNGASSGNLNINNQTNASWNWKAGTSFTNDASGTGIGTIDSAGSVNQDAGFSICSYTGSGSAATIKHGLNTAPKAIIVKNRDDARPWTFSSTGIGFDHILKLNETSAKENDDEMFNDTAPTNSVFSVKDNIFTNHNGHKYIAYCFADVKGYSKVSGSYVGNGSSSGPYIHLGFKPAFIMVKNTSTGGWQLRDNKRTTFNLLTNLNYANSSSAEQTTDGIDFLSNGWKLRNAAGDNNASGTAYIYMAFAENPFVTSTGVPGTAR